jgi:hypothetical protein
MPPGFGTSWTPQEKPMRLPALPKGLDLGVIVVGVGALLTLLGFLCGAVGIGAVGSAYQGWLEAFFVVTGVGVFLVIGGWVVHILMGARPGRY